MKNTLFVTFAILLMLPLVAAATNFNSDVIYASDGGIGPGSSFYGVDKFVDGMRVRVNEKYRFQYCVERLSEMNELIVESENATNTFESEFLEAEALFNKSYFKLPVEDVEIMKVPKNEIQNLGSVVRLHARAGEREQIHIAIQEHKQMVLQKRVQEQKPSGDKVCCKTYGYGSNMREVGVKYRWMNTNDCSVPANFVGGNKEIVDDVTCVRGGQ